MAAFRDLTGERFGRLFVSSMAERRRNKIYWVCKCDCGEVIEVETSSLNSGHTRSCGCLRVECLQNRHNDLTGKKFGKLTVLGPTRERGRIEWKCLCDCGRETVVKTGNLNNGHTRSCGCIVPEFTRKRTSTHGMSKKRIYKIWYGIIKRCEDVNNKSYPNYGGRGISICKEWREDFMLFYNWAMSHGYAEDLSIDRIDNYGNYCPENCRWVTMKEQNRNRRSNVYLSFNGETKCLKDWSKELGIADSALHKRLRDGWTIERALSTGNVNNTNMIEYNGKKMLAADWEKECGIKKRTITARIMRGWSVEEALTIKPVIGNNQGLRSSTREPKRATPPRISPASSD